MLFFEKDFTATAKRFKASDIHLFPHHQLVVLYQFVCDDDEYASGLCAGLSFNLAASCQDLVTPVTFVSELAAEITSAFETKFIPPLFALKIKEIVEQHTSLVSNPLQWCGLEPEFSSPFYKLISTSSLDVSSSDEFVEKLMKVFYFQKATSLAIAYVHNLSSSMGHVLLCGSFYDTSDRASEKLSYYFFDPSNGLMVWQDCGLFLSFLSALAEDLYFQQESLRFSDLSRLKSKHELLFASAYSCDTSEFTIDSSILPMADAAASMLTFFASPVSPKQISDMQPNMFPELHP